MLTFSSYAQQTDPYKEIISLYDSFEFEELITKADTFLQHKTNYRDEIIINVYLMKAIAYYSIDQDEKTRTSFFEILKIDDNYQPDPQQISPKIVQLFNKAKQEFFIIRDSVKPEQNNYTPTRIEYITKHDTILIQKEHYLGMSPKLKSILLPGLGHLDEDNVGGWFYIGASAILAGAITYYTIETNRLEEKYLNERDKVEIAKKYSKYNDAYHIRNGLIIGYIGVWSYAQLDFFVFRSYSNKENKGTSEQFLNNQMNLNVRFRF